MRQYPRRVETFSRAEARRTAIAAQGFSGTARTPESARPSRRRLLRLADDLGVLQLDSVSALVRSHYLPAYSRLGPYSRTTLDHLAWRDRSVVETWAHEAALVPMHREPLLRWRHDVACQEASNPKKWFHRASLETGLIDDVLSHIRDLGALSASDLRHLEEKPRAKGGWWNWSDVKLVCEYLFAIGQVYVAERRGFERRYDLPERVLAPEILATPAPPEDEARRQLLLLAAGSLGIATANDLADYYRMKKTIAAARIAELIEAGSLIEVGVDGWGRSAYVRPDVAVPSRMRARALVSMFDSLVFCRPRAERLFDFPYPIEIYTPEPKRIYGYYVLPFLLGDRIVARVDLRADRAAGVLRVPGAYAEHGARPDAVGPALHEELRLLAHWLELETIEYGDRGDLMEGLRSAEKPGSGPRPSANPPPL